MAGRWQPKEIRRYVETVKSSTNVAIVDTDAGTGYLKAMGNPEGEHALACEWVGTLLAEWFGLRTFDFAIIWIDADIDEIRFLDGTLAKSGPAFITKAEEGEPWSGTARQLKTLANLDDISRLVVFDTWIINRDRHSPGRVNRDNVFLSTETENRQLEVVAADHTHCFGASGEITRHVTDISNRRDPQVYGFFPEFRSFLDRNVVTRCVTKLGTIETETAKGFVQSIPNEWEVTQSGRDALADLIVARAQFVAENIETRLWPQQDIEFTDEAENDR